MTEKALPDFSVPKKPSGEKSALQQAKEVLPLGGNSWGILK